MIPFRLVISALCAGALAISGAIAQERPTTLTATSEQVLGTETATKFASTLPIDEDVSWEVFIPESYDPAVPAGLVVFISPRGSAKMPLRWKPMFESENLIYIGANKSGNQVEVYRRILYALMGQGLMARDYAIDPQRTYISGFSGGARTATFVSALFPEFFSGGIYICGADYGDPIEPKPEFHDNRHVLITGSRDSARSAVRTAYKAMQEGGAENVRLLDLRGYGHEMPDPSQLSTAIAFLDEGLVPAE